MEKIVEYSGIHDHSWPKSLVLNKNLIFIKCMLLKIHYNSGSMILQVLNVDIHLSQCF